MGQLNNNFSSLSDLKVNFSYIFESKFERIKNPKFKLNSTLKLKAKMIEGFNSEMDIDLKQSTIQNDIQPLSLIRYIGFWKLDQIGHM